jgi:hypothetical protein
MAAGAHVDLPVTRRHFHLRGLCASIVLLGACHAKPRPGAACKQSGELACVAGARALACQSGFWTELPCRGAKGCVPGANDDCDDTIAAEDDPCPREAPPDYACTADRSTALVCDAGRFRLWRRCRGARHCEVNAGRLHCDTSVGDVGDRCETVGAYACSVDRQSMLTCDGRALVTASSCRGPEGCNFDGQESQERKVQCDDRIAMEGDACESVDRITCGAGNGFELVCDGHRYRKKRECRRGGCRIQDDELFCD